MNKTLYISDLDGTLLNREARLDDYTIEKLNERIGQGLHFTIATARTAATVVKMMEQVHIQEPVILMNGVCIYDLQQQTYLHIEEIPAASREFFLQTLEHHQLSGFLYIIEQDHLHTCYDRIDTHQAEAFMQERIREYGKKFTKVPSLLNCVDRPIVYYSVSGPKERLEPVYEILITDSNLHIEFYRDIYREEEWYLEICSCRASKYNAVNYIRKHYGYERIVGFGDNLNDLPLFAACDRSYAVANAKPEVQKKADAVIESNVEHGVVCQIEREMVILNDNPA